MRRFLKRFCPADTGAARMFDSRVWNLWISGFGFHDQSSTFAIHHQQFFPQRRLHLLYKFPFSPHKPHPPSFQFLSPLRQPKLLPFHLQKSPFFPPLSRSTLVSTCCNSMPMTHAKSASLTRLRERHSRSGLHRQYNSRTLPDKMDMCLTVFGSFTCRYR